MPIELSQVPDSIPSVESLEAPKVIITLDSIVQKGLIKVEIPHGKIAPEGIAEIQELLKTQGFESFPTAEQVEHVWQAARGTFTKRLNKWFLINEKKELQPSLMTQVGNIAQRSSGGTKEKKPETDKKSDNEPELIYKKTVEKTKNPEKYFFNVVPPPFNWRDGYYGKAGSCWWSSNHKEFWEAMKGHCILFYKSENPQPDNGIGRLWINNVAENVFLLFNGYYNNDESVNWTFRLTKAFATAMGFTYRKIELESQQMHINGDIGYLSGVNSESIAKYLETLPKGVKIQRLKLVPPRIRKVYCRQCETKLEEEADEVRIQGGVYCHDCAELYFSDCSRCHQKVHKQYTWFIDEQLICDRCRQQLAGSCINCGKFHFNEKLIRLTDIKGIAFHIYICEDCFESQTFECYDCKTRMLVLCKVEFTTPECLVCHELPDMVLKVNICHDCLGKRYSLSSDIELL